MEFSIKDFFSKCDQIRRKLRIWSHLLKKSLMENFIFCAVFEIQHIKKSDSQLKVLAYSHNFTTRFNWFWENVKHNLYFLGRSYRVCKDIQYIPNTLFLFWID